MDKLKKAYEARAKKLNKIEKIKASKAPMEAFEKLEEYAKNGYDSIPDEDKKYFLKCFGIYDKDSLTPKQFMIRVRIPGGYLNANQARVLGEIAKEYGNDYIDITTRAQIELRYIDIKDIPTIFKKMSDVGISSYQTGVDNFRNIVTDPLDTQGFDTILPSYDLLTKLQSKFLHNPEWISALPRKFNTSITGAISNRCNAFGHDCCFVLAQKNGVYGYNLYLGGKVGKIAQNANIFLSSSDEVEQCYDSLIDIFKRFGFRDNRNKNRLHFLIEAVGMEEISKAIRENARVDFQTAGETLTSLDFSDPDQGRVQLRDGSFAVYMVVPSGIFSGSDMIAVSKVSQKYGNSQIRLDVTQNIYILGVKDVDALLREEIFQKYKSKDSIYKNHLIACAGTQHCTFGVIANKPDALSMAEYLEKTVPIEDGKVRMYWSACVKGCGLHGIGDIGFEGCKTKVDGVSEDGVHISLGGKLTSQGEEGYTVIKSAPLRFAKYYVETLMREYKKLKLKDESFEKFHDRVLSEYSKHYIGFYMQLLAYLRAKNIQIDLDIDRVKHTGKNEQFEIFELGRKLYYHLTKEEPYSAYERFTKANEREKLTPIQKKLPNLDEKLSEMINKMLEGRVLVFSELVEYVRGG